MSVGRGRLFPWAPLATVFVAVDDDGAWRVQPGDTVESVDTTGYEPWGRFEPTRIERLEGVGPALARAEVAIAA